MRHTRFTKPAADMGDKLETLSVGGCWPCPAHSSSPPGHARARAFLYTRAADTKPETETPETETLNSKSQTLFLRNPHPPSWTLNQCQNRACA